MITLAIETSNPSAVTPRSVARPGVALRWEGHPAREASEPVKLDDPHFDDLASAINRLTEREGVTPRGIAQIAVSVGPGGYTATRLSVMTAKMIAEATGARCIAIPTADVVAARAPRRDQPFAVALASKHTTAYVSLFNADGTPLAEGRIMDAAAFIEARTTLLIADAFLPQTFRDACANHSVPIIEPEFDPLACAAIAHRYPPVDPAAIAPIYPREPEAVTKWRELQRAKSRNA